MAQVKSRHDALAQDLQTLLAQRAAADEIKGVVLRALGASAGTSAARPALAAPGSLPPGVARPALVAPTTITGEGPA